MNMPAITLPGRTLLCDFCVARRCGIPLRDVEAPAP
jgi:hypothetical protein